ncbi:MAG: CpsD/CapB family tyrosine-protein kinase, partial [Planctomycetota bacterium]|nr:CpsD/CapB family tyrosine-protein kinase [Planctomycetota bacterium]
IAEQFRSLRNSITALNRDGGSHTIVMTSAVAGEGKTVATLNLAFALAEMPGTQVLVIDGDLHGPAVESYLELPRRQGLTEILSGDLPMERGVRRTAVERVSVMGPGTLPLNPSELLGSDRMRALLNELKQRFTYVLIDTPAVTQVSDASLLGSKVDGIVLVVRLGKTPRHEVEQTYNNLEALGGNILGTCLTGA